MTGAGGRLGGSFVSVCPSHHELAEAVTHADLDIGDRRAVMQTLVPLAPELMRERGRVDRTSTGASRSGRAASGRRASPWPRARAARC